MVAALHESASGPKQTQASAPNVSAFGGKADMIFAGIRFRGRYWGKADTPFCSAGVR
jgi:hypothetical protein